MKTIEKKYYVCDICGKTATDEQKIVACQRSHHDIAEAEAEATSRKGKPFPYTIKFRFPDGTAAEYCCNYCTDTAGKVSKYEA